MGQAIAARKKITGTEILLRILAWDGIKFLLLDEGANPESTNEKENP